jgi:hypothetical protein
MLNVPSTPRNRRVTPILCAAGGVVALGAVAVGISDNPPGIALAYLAVIALVLAFVHPWRSVRRFLFLILASVLGFVVFAVLHNLLDVIADSAGAGGALRGVAEVLGAAAFLTALLLCPAALLVGTVGALSAFIQDRRRSVPTANRSD